MCHNSDVRDIRRVIEEESEAVTVTIMMRDVFTALVRQGGNFANNAYFHITTGRHKNIRLVANLPSAIQLAWSFFNISFGSFCGKN